MSTATNVLDAGCRGMTTGPHRTADTAEYPSHQEHSIVSVDTLGHART